MEITDTLVSFGGSVKALDDSGKVGGHLVLFGDPEQPDLAREFFDGATDYDIEDGAKSRIYYAHALDPTIKARKIGSGTMEVQDAGVWIEGQLALRDDYERGILGMVKAEKLGWSSGTAAHLVQRTRVKSAYHIDMWPLGLDASLTPRPAEPRTMAVPLKSLQILDGALGVIGDSLKVAPLGDMANTSVVMAGLQALQDALWCRLCDVIFGYCDGPYQAPPGQDVTLGDLFDEFRDRALSILGRAPSDRKEIVGPLAGSTFADYSESVLAAVKEWTERMDTIHRLRVKDGRVLSGTNVDRLNKIDGHLAEARQHIGEMMSAAQKPEDGATKEEDRKATDKLRTQFLRQLVGARIGALA